MAVYAAHLTRTLQGTPSVFQVTAQEALGATVKPALRKLVEGNIKFLSPYKLNLIENKFNLNTIKIHQKLGWISYDRTFNILQFKGKMKYLAAVYPNRCGWCERWYDELYLLLAYSIQYHYLKHYAASFSESFYGLLRVPISPSTEFNAGTRLPEAMERASLALLVLVPYVRDTVEKLVHRWREDLEDGRLGKSKTDQARKAAVRLYSIAYFVTEACKLVVLARYLTGKGKAPLLSLHVLGLTLKDAPPREYEDTWRDFYRNILAGQYGSAVITFPMIYRILSGAIEHGAFAVQLLRWWDAQAPLALHSLPPPPALQVDERSKRLMNLCPVCLQHWKVPTVLPVSGYIFCYTCISRHLRSQAACPVTRLPATERSLVRLYLDA